MSLDQKIQLVWWRYKVSAVKLPTRQIVNYQTAPALPEYIAEILFEDIGGTELINMVRHDTVSGINVAYNIISNLTQINLKFDPSLALAGYGTYDPIFSRYKIKLETKIPLEEFYTLTEDIAQTPISPETSANIDNVANNFYINSDGDLVIELTNILSDEIVELEVRSDGTIYPVREYDNQ